MIIEQPKRATGVYLYYNQKMSNQTHVSNKKIDGVNKMKLKILALISFTVLMLGNTMIAEASSGIDRRDIFVGASARAVGMGSAFTAGPSANNGFLWNPSSLGFMNGLEVNLGGIPFSGESSGPDQAFSFAASPNTLGLTNKDVGSLSIASWFNGLNNGNNESTQIMLLGYGLALGPQASAGANLRYYQNNIQEINKYLWSIDVGMQFTYPLEMLGDSITFGMNLSELSNGIRYSNGELIEPLAESMPLAVRFGSTYRIDSATLLSADFAIRGQNDVTWGERLRLHIGGERWLFDNHFGVRLGYTALTASDRFSSGQWTQGISFRNASGQLDYAHVSGGELDQSLHWITATLRWGGIKQSRTPAPKPTVNVKTENIPNTDTASTILMPKTLNPDAKPVGSPDELELSETAISPNTDGIKDSTEFRFRAKANEKWKLTLRDAYTEVVWEKSGTGSPAQAIVWNGMGNDDKLVPDGDYVLQLYIVDAQGKTYLRNSKKLTVDLIPTSVELSKSGTKTVAVKVWEINQIANWKLEIFDTNNNLIENSEGSGAPPETIVLTKVPQMSTTTYKFAINVQDMAGNHSKHQAELQFGSGNTTTETKTSNLAPTMTLMVGSFAERRNANLMFDNLQRLFPNETVKIYTATVNGQAMHRVTIGAFVERSDASALIQQIQEAQGVEPILITP